MAGGEIAQKLRYSTLLLREALSALPLEPFFVYHPLFYAWEAHCDYLEQYADSGKKILFLGMNPGPFGMAQTGVPFGDVVLVKNWLGIYKSISQPERMHPCRPIQGFDCPRPEISGRRFWGYFASRYSSAQAFFKDHFVSNYCPLLFLKPSGCNLTPDHLAMSQRQAIQQHCDAFLRALVEILSPSWVVGVGNFACQSAVRALAEFERVAVSKILHPSPANPLANKGWEREVDAALAPVYQQLSLSDPSVACQS